MSSVQVSSVQCPVFSVGRTWRHSERKLWCLGGSMWVPRQGLGLIWLHEERSLGPVLNPLRRSWGSQSTFAAQVGAPEAILAPSQGGPWMTSGPLGLFKPEPHGILDGLGAILAPSWRSWGTPGSKLGAPGGIWSPSWGAEAPQGSHRGGARFTINSLTIHLGAYAS